MNLRLFTRKAGKHIHRTIIFQKPCASNALFKLTLNRIHLHFSQMGSS